MGERGAHRTIDAGTGETTSDDDGTTVVYRDNAADLVRMATMMVGPADAHDVFVEAVLAATRAERWAGLDADQRRAYLYRSTVNRAREWARSTARRRRREAI